MKYRNGLSLKQKWTQRKVITKAKYTDPLVDATISDVDVWIAVGLVLVVVAATGAEVVAPTELHLHNHTSSEPF